MPKSDAQSTDDAGESIHREAETRTGVVLAALATAGLVAKRAA